jgi:hypothetical protein
MTPARACYKKGRTTRINAQALVDGLPLNLASRIIEVKLAEDEQSSTVLTLTAGAGAGVANAVEGRFWWEVSQANLTTLGDPGNVWTVLNWYNADNTLAFEAYGNIEVRL